MFIGYIRWNSDMYTFFQNVWYTLIFKPVLEIKWKTKWNVDAELVLQSMIDFEKYNKAVIVTWDGDFACLIQYLYKQSKLEKLIVPNKHKFSSFLKSSAKEKIDNITNLRNKLEFKT
jgi:uncharacterized LabA/DUF88 family protein